MIPLTQGSTYFSPTDLTYTNNQLNLHPDTTQLCIVYEMSKVYEFKTGSYGLIDIPAEFQQLMNYTLIGLITHPE